MKKVLDYYDEVDEEGNRNIRGDLLVIDSKQFETQGILPVSVNILNEMALNNKNWRILILLSFLCLKMPELNHLLFTMKIYKGGSDEELKNSLVLACQLYRFEFFV